MLTDSLIRNVAFMKDGDVQALTLSCTRLLYSQNFEAAEYVCVCVCVCLPVCLSDISVVYIPGLSLFDEFSVSFMIS